MEDLGVRASKFLFDFLTIRDIYNYMNNKEVNVPLGQVINYCCNRFMPLILIPILLFVSLGVSSWIAWTIICLMIFIDKNCFKVGYAVGYVDSKEGREYGAKGFEDESE